MGDDKRKGRSKRGDGRERERDGGRERDRDPKAHKGIEEETSKETTRYIERQSKREDGAERGSKADRSSTA